MKSGSLHHASAYGAICAMLLSLGLYPTSDVAAQQPGARAAAAPAGADGSPLVQIGPGDTLTIAVFGQPDMANTLSVSDDGTIPVPLAGSVMVSGLSPAQAGTRLEKAYRDGNILVNPQVTVTVALSRSQRVSVLGQVGTPGRFPIDSNTSILDLMAMTGGITETGSDQFELIRTGADGKVQRQTYSLKAITDGTQPGPALKGGDTIVVARAEQFYIYGEVSGPGKFRIEQGMTMIQAIARAGGITARGSQRRVEVKRKAPDGSYLTKKVGLGDLVLPDDVIRVKESIF